ncbi:hypothetical protein NP233_g10777 [Leucocoprinus birnbaumii]|uniref:Uncharacterized protein n=1 Tax=Leucocoprinus birnbaumii TaxID=56174 RepID=A0AAD5VHV0_9AGAR|nr:hypothetical protein NP233_g10777 [Leucocoprinus birnbaumii]
MIESQSEDEADVEVEDGNKHLTEQEKHNEEVHEENIMKDGNGNEEKKGGDVLDDVDNNETLLKSGLEHNKEEVPEREEGEVLDDGGGYRVPNKLNEIPILNRQHCKCGVVVSPTEYSDLGTPVMCTQSSSATDIKVLSNVWLVKKKFQDRLRPGIAVNAGQGLFSYPV